MDNGCLTTPRPLKGALMNLDITGALASMHAAFELAKVAVEARDDAKVKAALSEMAERFTDANMGALAMSQTLRQLEAELRNATARLADLEKRNKKREAHVMFEVRKGAFVYLFEPLPEDKSPRHYKCQVCFDAGEDSVLVTSTNGRILLCNITKEHSITLEAAPGYESSGRLR